MKQLEASTTSKSSSFKLTTPHPQPRRRRPPPTRPPPRTAQEDGQERYVPPHPSSPLSLGRPVIPPQGNRSNRFPPPPTAKSRTIIVRLVSMAATGFFYTFTRPRQALPMSMLKYDPIGKDATIPPPDETRWDETRMGGGQ